MQIAETVLEPVTAVPDVWNYILALMDDDWEQWDTTEQIVRYNGCRRSATGRWNLRDIRSGAPVDWDYADSEVVVLEVLSR